MRESLIDAIDRKAAVALAKKGTCRECSAPITSLEWDSTRGVTVTGHAKRGRLRFECSAGHVQDLLVTAAIAKRANDILQVHWRSVPA